MATQPNEMNPAEKVFNVASETVVAPVVQAEVPVKAPESTPVVAKVAEVKVPAKRGRKPGSKNVAKVAKAAEVKVPAKRGRKPGSKNTVKTDAKIAAKSGRKFTSIRSAAPVSSVAAKMKETAMNTTEKLTGEFKAAADKFQAEAKQSFSKGTAILGDAQAFAKGNVEALVASGKILGEGFKALGESFVSETRMTIETLQADTKALAATKSPNEFVQLQGEIARRNVERAVAVTSKNAETMLKLANDAFAPIAGRVTLAVDKVRKAA